MTVILKNRRPEPGILRSLILGVLVAALLLTLAACGKRIEDQIRAMQARARQSSSSASSLQTGKPTKSPSTAHSI